MQAENWTRGAHPSEPAEGGRDQAHTHVTAGDLRRLLDAGVDTARLVLEEGRVQVDPGLDDRHRGLVIITRDDLLERVGEHPDDTRLDEQATVLDTEIAQQGA